MSQKDQDLTALCIGAAVGTLVGATMALLLAPKTGERLRRDICEACNSVNEKAKDIAHDIADMGHKAYDTASDYADEIKETATHMLGPKKQGANLASYVAIGAIAGTILSALALTLHTKRSEEAALSFAHKIKAAGKTARNNFQSIDWFETGKNALDAVRDRLESSAQARSSNAHNLLDWTVFGLNLLQNIKKRR